MPDSLAPSSFEMQFEDDLNLPKGKYEIPLAIYDRSFDREGQLYYPVSPEPESPWVPEVFGDAILVNGKMFPYLEVEPRKYRFRFSTRPMGASFTSRFRTDRSSTRLGRTWACCPSLCR